MGVGGSGHGDRPARARGTLFRSAMNGRSTTMYETVARNSEIDATSKMFNASPRRPECVSPCVFNQRTTGSCQRNRLYEMRPTDARGRHWKKRASRDPLVVVTSAIRRSPNEIETVVLTSTPG